MVVVAKEIAKHVCSRATISKASFSSFYLGRRDGKVCRSSYRREIGWADQHAHTEIGFLQAVHALCSLKLWRGTVLWVIRSCMLVYIAGILAAGRGRLLLETLCISIAILTHSPPKLLVWWQERRLRLAAQWLRRLLFVEAAALRRNDALAQCRLLLLILLRRCLFGAVAFEASRTLLYIFFIEIRMVFLKFCIAFNTTVHALP